VNGARRCGAGVNRQRAWQRLPWSCRAEGIRAGEQPHGLGGRTFRGEGFQQSDVLLLLCRRAGVAGGAESAPKRWHEAEIEATGDRCNSGGEPFGLAQFLVR